MCQNRRGITTNLNIPMRFRCLPNRKNRSFECLIRKIQQNYGKDYFINYLTVLKIQHNNKCNTCYKCSVRWNNQKHIFDIHTSDILSSRAFFVMKTNENKLHEFPDINISNILTENRKRKKSN